MQVSDRLAVNQNNVTKPTLMQMSDMLAFLGNFTYSDFELSHLEFCVVNGAVSETSHYKVEAHRKTRKWKVQQFNRKVTNQTCLAKRILL
jgi:hypothetical protein